MTELGPRGIDSNIAYLETRMRHLETELEYLRQQLATWHDQLQEKQPDDPAI